MASYFNLTLDTTAPSGLKVSINDDALYTTSTTVTVKLTLSDEQTSGYQMKIWGIAGAANEGDQVGLPTSGSVFTSVFPLFLDERQ